VGEKSTNNRETANAPRGRKGGKGFNRKKGLASGWFRIWFKKNEKTPIFRSAEKKESNQKGGTASATPKGPINETDRKRKNLLTKGPWRKRQLGMMETKKTTKAPPIPNRCRTGSGARGNRGDTQYETQGIFDSSYSSLGE